MNSFFYANKSKSDWIARAINFAVCLTVCLTLSQTPLQGEILYVDDHSILTEEALAADILYDPILCGSSCKRPKQGPPGPAFDSYISRSCMTPQTLSSGFLFQPIDFDTPIVASPDWTYSGGRFSSTTSGIYVVSFKVMFDMTKPKAGADTLAIQVLQNIPAGVIFPQSYSQVQILSNPAPNNRPITLESTFMIYYKAGTQIAFMFFGADLTPFNTFDPITKSGSASMEIFRVN